MPSSPPPISISTNAASTAADITISSPTASDKSPAPRSKERHQNTSIHKSQPLNGSKSSRNVLNAKSNGKAGQKSDAADRGDDGDSENPGEPPSTPPHSTHDRSDSEAETIVIPGSRMRQHRNRLFKNETGEVSQRNGSGRMTNGDSKGKDHDKDGEDDDGDSSVLSSPPTSPLPPNMSKGGSGKNGTAGRSSAANLSNGNRGRILHRRTNSSSSASRNLSPPIKQRSSRRDTSNENNPRSRNSRKRKGRSGSPPRKRRGSNDEARRSNEDRSPTRGIRVKSSPPVSPPPPPSALLPPPPPPDKHNTSSSPSNSLLPSPLPNNNHNGSGKRHSSHGSVSHHHTRNKTSISAALASPSKTSQSSRSLKSKRLPAPLRISRGASTDDRSTSSSRSTSPQTMPRLRRPSLSGSAASPIRAMAGGHKPKRDNAGRTHFFKHCAKGHLDEAVQLLNGETEPLFEADNAGYLPIHAAALGGYTETVKFLIQAGSPIDVAAKDLSTPLLDAVENLHLEVVVLLLEAGADPRKRNENGQTVIDVAASLRKNDPDNAKEMEVIEKHLQTAVTKLRSKRSSDDENARASAALESSSSRAASVASPVHQSPPPSAMAHTSSSSRRRTGRSEITRNDLLWLDSGKGGMQKLRDASRTGDIEMVGKLLESGNVPDVDSVVLAAKGGHADVLNILLAFGADSDPDPQESSRHVPKEKGGSSLPPGEDTPLLATIGRGNLNILRLLLKSDTMKDPRRTDKKGRTYMDIARDRAGDNWEEEIKILQKAYDDAAPRGKKSLRDKSARELSPTTSRKSGVSSASISKQKTASSSKEAEQSAKPTKRARRGSVTDEISTQTLVIGDTINVSSREPTPRLKAGAAASKATEKEQRDREREKDKRREKERRDSEGNDLQATATDPVKKKRRLISGKDLANASSQSQPSKTAAASSKSAKKSKAEDDDVDMMDPPPPPVPSKKGSISDDKERPIIKRERERSTDSSLPAKRHRESSTSSLNRVRETDKSSDVERATIKKRRKLEESAERSGSGTDKEKSKAEAIEKRRRERASLSKDSPEPQRERERRSKDVLEKRRAREASETTSTTSATVTEEKERKSERRERREREEREKLKEERDKRREREKGDREKVRDLSKDKIKEREKERSSKLREKEEERETPRERDRESKIKDRAEREKLREKLREKKRAEREREKDNNNNTNNTENDEESEKPAKDSSSEASRKKKKRRDDDEARKDLDGDVRMKEEPVDDDGAVLRTKDVPMKDMTEEHEAEEAEKKAKEAEEEMAAQRAKDEAEAAAAREQARCDVLTQEIRAQQEKARAEGEAAAVEFARLKKEKELERQRLEEEARLQAEAAEKARLEKEAREKQAAEEALRRKAEEEARLEAERIAKEKEEEAKRLALEEEMRQKKIAEEKERETKRIEALPWVLREAAKVQDKHAYLRTLLANKKYFSLYVADLDNLTASKPLARPAPEDLYISSLQAIILLGTPEDLELRQYPGLGRKEVTLEDRHQLRNILQPLYTRDISLHTPSDYKIYDIKSAWEMKNAEGDKFESLKELYWIKVSDFLNTLKANEKKGNFANAFVYQYLSRTS